MTFAGLAILGFGFFLMTLVGAHRVRSAGINPHYAWFIVATATILQLTTGFVSQAFAILLVVLQEDFGWTLTAITLAYFFRTRLGLGRRKVRRTAVHVCRSNLVCRRLVASGHRQPCVATIHLL